MLQVPLAPDGRARPRQRRGLPAVASVRGAAAAGERDVVGSSRRDGRQGALGQHCKKPPVLLRHV